MKFKICASVTLMMIFALSVKTYSQTVAGWDAVLTSGYNNGTTVNNNYHLIGTYQGWDPNAIYIAGYHFYNNPNIATKRIYMGSLFQDLANGRIGIGSSSPRAAVEIVRGGTNSGEDYPALHISSHASGNIYGPILYLNATSGTGGRMWGICSSGQLDAGATGAAGNFAIYDSNGGSRLVINGSGNIGIGTTSPDAKLAVQGTIHTQEVKVDMNGWADYVFKPTYKLPSLTSVKAYIDKNQHLPEMPSEAEVAKNGVNLGEIVKLQTKKIEELTLYLIEQNKRLKTQEEQIKFLLHKSKSKTK
jgi:hypothetical protein